MPMAFPWSLQCPNLYTPDNDPEERASVFFPLPTPSPPTGHHRCLQLSADAGCECRFGGCNLYPLKLSFWRLVSQFLQAFNTLFIQQLTRGVRDRTSPLLPIPLSKGDLLHYYAEMCRICWDVPGWSNPKVTLPWDWGQTCREDLRTRGSSSCSSPWARGALPSQSN